MTPVVVEGRRVIAAVSSVLVRLEDRRIDAQAARIDVFGKAFGGHLACHFGDVFGVLEYSLVSR